ncbi:MULTISPECIES: GNAT family protein [Arthrobacter]|uniref:GNAT family protein n=2 Tax=Arthrobacter TaxID=1663 RepID=A0ABU9KKF1_9MICC|nr:GNAT family protein [Arthrobacter sp. YJM1]MDP5227379.1 GNAT family protein [Arthrobacter sp. YJM1]
MLTLEEIFPPFGLRLRTPRLELRILQDGDLPELMVAVDAGIHEPGQSPFSVPWSEAPAEELPANMARFHWGTRSGFTPEKWELAFGVWFEGALIGSQSLTAHDFAKRRAVESGSWLRKDFQGWGIGKEMRAAILLYAFDFLGASMAESSAMTWNRRSLGVSYALGYLDNGLRREYDSQGGATEVQHLRLDAQNLLRPAWTLDVAGHEAFARFVGLTPPAK